MKSKPPTPATVASFKDQVAHWAARIRVRPRQLRLLRMRRKWASCSARGTVSFSTEVLTQPPAFREYVIVHELLHLKVPNHGKLFKTLLRAYIPNFENIRPCQKVSMNTSATVEAPSIRRLRMQGAATH